MGLGYTLFVKPVLVFALALAGLSGMYLLPEYWPDYAIAREAILGNDTIALQRYLARGLDPEERAQWRSWFRRSFGRTTTAGVGDSTPDLGAAGQSLLDYALSRCTTTQPAVLLVEAGADVTSRDFGGWTLLGRAAACDAVALTSAMLSRGADSNADEPDGGTVLWEPTNRGWQRRPFTPAIIEGLQRAGASRPTRAAVHR